MSLAARMASNDIEHGPIECVFTRDEETGLTGAHGMKAGFMTGKMLINLDSEDEVSLFLHFQVFSVLGKCGEYRTVGARLFAES